jgi:leader peptidase (prepilin peptidase)/N-methyltransferase
VTVFLAVLCAVLGLAIGSFLTVVVHRVPRGESVVRPRSRCPGCGKVVGPRDNVPVLSWLLLRGKCRGCGEPISIRYPLTEVATAALFAATAVRLRHAPHGQAVLASYLVLDAAILALALIDLETMKLPDILTLPLYATGMLLLVLPSALVGDSHASVRALEGMAGVYAAYFLLCYLTAGRGLGFGDVKLSGPLGLHLAWLGWRELAVGLLATQLLAGVVAVALLSRGRAGRKSRLPFGPFLVAGTIVGMLAGAPLGRLWLGS